MHYLTEESCRAILNVAVIYSYNIQAIIKEDGKTEAN